MDVPLWAWAAVVGGILVMLAVDLVAHRRAHVISVREAGLWSGIWVAVGVGFGALLWSVYGSETGQQYFSGYLIEKSLAVDNVFVWAIIFTHFAVPREYQHRVLFLGVVGALVFRGAFIAVGSVLIENFAWILYVFAAFLLYTGWTMIRHRNEHLDPERSRVLRLFRRHVPTTDTYQGQRLLVRRGGTLLATPLLVVLLMIEVTDIVFAVDSIPAIFAVTDEPFLVFTANAFAILGLRAMYFLLADLIHRFVYLKLGLALVLVWVGVKMMLKVDVVYIPTTISLAVIGTIITVSVVASLRATRRRDGDPGRLPPVATPDSGGQHRGEPAPERVGHQGETGAAVRPGGTTDQVGAARGQHRRDP
jgi:tellurite resistance protein TerC